MKSIKVYNEKDFPRYLPKLNSLYDDLFSGGKGFRSQLIQLFSEDLKLNEKQTLLLSQTIEFIHNASLLHDDLIDRSHLRRNKPAAWLKYNAEYAVLAGDYLLARVMVNLSSYGNLKLLQYTAEMISDLLEGEWIQDSLVNDFSVQLGQLDQVHRLKTSSLFKWCFRAPFLAAENYQEGVHHSLEKMGEIIGQLFQRSDDLLDFDVRNFEKKAVLGDLKSGYINSFGSYLMENLDAHQRAAFKNCQTIKGLFEVVGEEYFCERLNSFDQVNDELIDIYQFILKELYEKDKVLSEELFKKLERLPNLLYWRKK